MSLPNVIPFPFCLRYASNLTQYFHLSHSLNFFSSSLTVSPYLSLSLVLSLSLSRSLSNAALFPKNGLQIDSHKLKETLMHSLTHSLSLFPTRTLRLSTIITSAWYFLVRALISGLSKQRPLVRLSTNAQTQWLAFLTALAPQWRSKVILHTVQSVYCPYFTRTPSSHPYL